MSIQTSILALKVGDTDAQSQSMTDARKSHLEGIEAGAVPFRSPHLSVQFSNTAYSGTTANPFSVALDPKYADSEVIKELTDKSGSDVVVEAIGYGYAPNGELQETVRVTTPAKVVCDTNGQVSVYPAGNVEVSINGEKTDFALSASSKIRNDQAADARSMGVRRADTEVTA